MKILLLLAIFVAVVSAKDDRAMNNATNARSFTYRQSSGRLVGPGIDVVGCSDSKLSFFFSSPPNAQGPIGNYHGQSP
jgi:hypothetical protein